MKRFGIATVALLGIIVSPGAAEAQAYQLKQGSYALKSGESIEVSDLYWVINCRSQLTGAPEATILDGPPGVSVDVTEALVTPRAQNCPRPVKGAKLTLKAATLDDESNSLMTIRIKYPTKDGTREQDLVYSIALFP